MNYDYSNLKKKVKKYWDKFWFLLWKDDSLKGWIFSIIFLLVFIKLIFFPGLSLLTGTELPLAIVESCSMYHDGNLLSNFNEWYERHENKYNGFDIPKSEFREFKFKKGFNKGDILFIIGADAEDLEAGDVILFHGNRKNPIIHRIIDKKIDKDTGEIYFSTIGDNNNAQLQSEQNIHESQIIGKAVIRLVPYLGWGKLIFFELARPYSQRGFCEENKIVELPSIN
ncbi:signal peptidase I [Candidatus Pacearchaeota archaeon]|nr:signal peptidase I [Candidatus Pacearchaeota archaeon]